MAEKSITKSVVKISTPASRGIEISWNEVYEDATVDALLKSVITRYRKANNNVKANAFEKLLESEVYIGGQLAAMNIPISSYLPQAWEMNTGPDGDTTRKLDIRLAEIHAGGLF
jgi:hypothetical protein